MRLIRVSDIRNTFLFLKKGNVPRHDEEYTHSTNAARAVIENKNKYYHSWYHTDLPDKDVPWEKTDDGTKFEHSEEKKS